MIQFIGVFVTVRPDTEYGIHGYDNNVDSMKPIFLARGPRFKNGVTIDDEFKNIDLFNLFRRMLDIDSIDIDGDDPIHVWNGMLKKAITGEKPRSSDDFIYALESLRSP